MASIELRDLRKLFGGFVAVRGSEFTVGDGEFFVMLGPSGCGKTTTLRMIAGLESPTSGRILLDGEDVTARRASARDIAFVFQMFALYPHMSARRNIAFPLVCQGVSRGEIARRVDETARMLRIEHLLESPVNALSGGDRQRIGLGRALIRSPRAFLMDEPLGALDAEMRESMRWELRRLHERLKATTVYVTHDQSEAMAMADRIAVMNNGVVEQIGGPNEVYRRPATAFVADFIGNPPMNLLRLSGHLRRGERSVRMEGGDAAIPVVARDLPEGAFLGVRPENFRLDEKSPLRGRIVGVEYLGDSQIISAETKFGTLRARVAADVSVDEGANAGFSFHAADAALFDRRNGAVATLTEGAEVARG